MTHYQHVTDGPTFHLRTDSCLESETIVLGGAEYGRFLFRHDPAILVSGVRVVVKNCLIVLAPAGIEVIRGESPCLAIS
jgi:hypothetical protein